MNSENHTVLLPDVESIKAAASHLRPYVLKTPLIPLSNTGERRVYLKLENLQAVGSFKIRCAGNALLARRGQHQSFTTPSAGNFAQGLAYVGRLFGCAVTAVIPDTTAQSKRDALMQLGARIVERPYQEWWDLMEQTERIRNDQSFVHPVADTDVLAGNGTIGLEIFDELPTVKSVFVPFGGGGLSVGIAAAVHHYDADVAIYACETEAGTPVAAAFRAGEPTRVNFNPHTFITGMGSSQVLKPMWPLIKAQLKGALCCTLQEVARAIKRLLLDHHIVAEGAGAAAVAAALASPASSDPSVCIVSGGHLDPRHLIAVLNDRVPEY